MRSIRERLNQLQTEPAAAPAQSPEGVPVELIAPGIERTTARGSHFVVETAVNDPTSGFAGWQGVAQAMVPSSTNGRVDAGDILFLDTETTGLDRGTGTHVFLVGIGYFSGDRFHVQQHFLRDLHEEASLLCELDRLIREFSVLVTFNGRGFDWPMITSRFILHGYRDLPQLGHWDLLPSSRRIWKPRLRDCSLGSLERQILGVTRFGDVPGHLIPEIYFDYLRSRDARPLRPVFSHNQEDIVSLARLAEVLVRAEQDPPRTLTHPSDQISYGLHLLRQGDLVRAADLIRPNLHSPEIEPDLCFRGYKMLAEHCKRRAQLDEAVELWTGMFKHRWHESDKALYPIIELAKVYEHRVRDYRRALSYVEQGLRMVALRGWDSEGAALAHRYARLQRRLENERRRTRPSANTDRSTND